MPMRTKGIAFLAMTVIIAGCGNNPPSRAPDVGVNANSTYSTQIATPSPDSPTSTASILPVATNSATDSQVVTVPSTNSASPAPIDEPTPAAVEPLPLGTSPPSPTPTPAPFPSTPAQIPLPDGISDRVVSQWTTGWTLFGTKRAHVDLLVNYFPASFLAPPVEVTIEIAWTKGGAIVDTKDYGPWQLTAPNSEEASFDAPVDSDGEQIQLLPAQ